MDGGFLNFLGNIPWWGWIVLVIVIVAIRDMFFNKRHGITRNFPVVGHFRYMLEKIGPELRQYIVANNREELPFNRSQRSWIYASSKRENNYAGFGTDQDIHATNYMFIRNEMFPYPNKGDIKDGNNYFLPSAKVMGEYHKRKRPYRPYSILNISAMSFGSLSARAVESMNRGSKMCGCYHNTGEGGLSPYHSKGADVMFQFGTGYFGIRDDDGNFDLEKLVALVEKNPFVRAIELKLSQGAKPGKGGVLPAKKITKEIAEIRHVPEGQDVLSPAYHSAFSGIDGLIDFVESIAKATGLPVGIKAAIGKTNMWEELADKMKSTGRGPDFIAVDGGEGGTGAAPPSFANHVAVPWVYGFTQVYKIFQERDLTKHLTFIASGKLGLPSSAVMAFAMGADIIAAAREPMMSIGCIQAQVCHNNTCPSGVATQNKWLQRGIHIPIKSERFANYVNTFRKEVQELTHAAGYAHPCELGMEDVKMNTSDSFQTKTLRDIFGYEKDVVAFSGYDALKSDAHLGADYFRFSKEEGAEL